MKKQSWLARAFLLGVSLLSSIDAVSASWLITGDYTDKADTSASITTDDTKAVCYIKNRIDDVDIVTYYTSLDKALDVAYKNGKDDTIYVIPGLKKANDANAISPIEIKKDHTIESGDSFVLPYEGETFFKETDHGTLTSADYFADENASKVSEYRKTQVILNKTLNVCGTLNVGGVLGITTQPIAGQTTGAYCEITMKNGSKLNCLGGEINCYGYIKRYSSSDDSGNDPLMNVGDSKDGSRHGTLLTPLVIYDYKGGTKTYGAVTREDETKTDKFCPFYLFDFPNIQAKTNINCGSYWVSKTCLYAANTYNWINDLYFIAPSSDSSVKSILSQESNSVITVEYVPETNGYTTGTYHYYRDKDDKLILDSENKVTRGDRCTTKTKISIKGEVNIGSISADIELFGDEKNKIAIDSSEFYLPISYRLELVLESGSVLNSPNKVKLMNGTKVTINNNAILNLTAPLAVYDKGYYGISCSSNPSPYPTGLGNAQLINNGTIEVSSVADSDGSIISEGAIGGFIATEATTNGSAKIKYLTKSYSVNSPEPTAFGTVTATTSNYSIAATGDLYSYNETTKTFVKEENKNNIVYSSVAYDSVCESGKYGWKLVNTIVGVSISEVSGSSKHDTTAGTIQVKAEIDPAYFDVKYTWSLPDYPNSEDIYIEGSDATVTITNKTENEAKVKVKVTANDSEDSMEVTVPGKDTKKDIETITVSVYGQDNETTEPNYSYDYTTRDSDGELKTENVSNSQKVTVNHPTDTDTKKQNNYTWTVKVTMNKGKDYSVAEGTKVNYIWTIENIYQGSVKTGEVWIDKEEHSSSSKDTVSTYSDEISVITYGTSNTQYTSPYVSGTLIAPVKINIKLQIQYYRFDDDQNVLNVPNAKKPTGFAFFYFYRK